MEGIPTGQKGVWSEVENAEADTCENNKARKNEGTNIFPDFGHL